MDKNLALLKIAKEIERCPLCKLEKIGKAVAGEGDPNADIVFVGEAPGREEAKTGRPFVGRSGKLLRSLIKDIGFKEAEVYITSPVKYLPQRGTPTISQITHGRVHLLKQLEVIKPKIIVLLGRVACHALYQKHISVTTEHGKVFKENKNTYFVTLHPSAGIRFVRWKKLLIEDFKTLKSYITTLSPR